MSVVDDVKSLVSIANKLKDRELLEHVMNLQTKVMEYQDHIHRLEKENEDLKKQLTTHDSLIWENGVYFTMAGDKKDGPFCTRCWDVDKNLVRLRLYKDNSAVCLHCDKGFVYLKESRAWPTTSYGR